MARAKAAEAGVSLAATIHGDILDLPSLISETYDAVLCLGPLYHLLKQMERETAVALVKAALKPNGLLFAAFITRFAPFRDMAQKGHLDWIVTHEKRAEHILETGENPTSPGNSFPNSYFAHPGEVKPLMEGAGFQTLNLLAVEGVVAGHEEHINQASDELFQKWVALNYRLSQDPALYGAADHILYIGKMD